MASGELSASKIRQSLIGYSDLPYALEVVDDCCSRVDQSFNIFLAITGIHENFSGVLPK